MDSRAEVKTQRCAQETLGREKAAAQRVNTGPSRASACQLWIRRNIYAATDHDYPEVVGKTVAKVTVTNESDWRNITVRFTDNTAIHFGIRPFVQMEPEF